MQIQAALRPRKRPPSGTFARAESALADSALAHNEGYTRPTVGLRICFVTPFAWSQPHEVNAHVAGAAAALRKRGHDVTVLAPSTRARDLLAGRRALQRGVDAEVIAVGPSIPISRRTTLACRSRCAPISGCTCPRTLRRRARVEPGLPSLSYLALTSTDALTAATFFSTERLGYPTRRSRRDRLRIRVDALLATSEETAIAAAERFDGDYKLVPLGVDTTVFRPESKRRLIAVELESAGRPVTRAVIRLLRELPDWELYLPHTKPLGVRPSISRSLRPRVHVPLGAARGPSSPDPWPRPRSSSLHPSVSSVSSSKLELPGAAIAGGVTPDDVVDEVRETRPMRTRAGPARGTRACSSGTSQLRPGCDGSRKRSTEVNAKTPCTGRCRRRRTPRS